jgi:RimJ/RimL family protein N-acetyltransferase
MTTTSKTTTSATRVRLRELERRDLPQINAWRNDPQLVALLGGSFRHVCQAVDEAWYDRYMASRNHNVRLAICTGEEVVGAIYLLDIDWQHRNAELAIWIGEANARGNGIGRQAVKAMLDHAFGDLNLERVYLSVLTDNKRAVALYHSCSFSTEGVQRRATFKQGRWRDLLLMSVLNDEHLQGITHP